MHRKMRWKKSGRDFLALGDVTPARIHVKRGGIIIMDYESHQMES